MAWKENYYEQLILKIDQFTRKFYINQLIRGSLYFVGLLTLVFLAYNFLEGQFYFSRGVRTALGISYLALFAGTAWWWVARPALHYFRLGKLISHEEAARIIGTHFSDVRDKLLNVLQLKAQSVNYTDRSLIEASIAQKSMELQPVPFIHAIDLQRNRRYLHYAAGPLLLLASLLVFAPGMIHKPTQRLIQVDREFEREAPFHFVLETDTLAVEQNGDFTLRLRSEGTAIPAEAFIARDGYQYRLQKEGPETFKYTFSNVQRDVAFHIFSGAVSSPEYILRVMMKPLIEQFEVRLEYPPYTGKKKETAWNTGDLIIPAGTRVQWTFHSAHTDQMSMRLSGEQTPRLLQRSGESDFSASHSFRQDDAYVLYLRNHQLPHADSVVYQVRVIEDKYPQIDVEAFVDSSQWKVRYFAGTGSDDYGIRTILFKYAVRDKSGTEQAEKSITLAAGTVAKVIDFRHVFDIGTLNLQPGESVNYYFEVWDNDGVNGSKSSRSEVHTYREVSEDELAQQELANNEAIKDELREAIDDAKKLRERLGDFKDRLRQKKDLEWQHRQSLEKMLQDQQRIQQRLEEANKRLGENIQKQQPEDENVRNKQEQLQKLFNETASQEMKELMQQIQQLMSELNKEQTLKMAEQFESKNVDLEKEMERLLELFKQLEMEKNLKDQIADLREMADKQEALSEKTAGDKENSDSLKQQQDSLSKQFDEFGKKQDSLQKKNEGLKPPRKMEDRSGQQENIQKDMKDASQELGKSSKESKQQGKSKAAKKQKEASGKMKEMADQMEQEMQESDQEQAEEDARMLRQLLENLVALSFDQERLMKELGRVNAQTPKYLSLVQDQFRIKENFRIVEDTLDVLSKRVVEIQSFVMDKVGEIGDNFRDGLKHLEERRTGEASNNQGRIMKNMNDLALMLSETLDQKQKECKGGSCKKPGSKSCPNPGASGSGKSGRKPADKFTEGMQGLEKGMQQQLDRMRSGHQGTAKEFAELAAKQAKLRKMLQELEKENSESGHGSSEARQAMEEMNRIEKQLVNKQLTNEMLKRTQEITTRLLEADRSEREREWDEQRKSETGTNIERKFPPGLEEYIKKRQGETEWFKQISPELRPFYRNLVEQYYQGLKKQG
ncbi:MAG: DUF4175 domain-containing protein [Saprospiraceae bacterium]|nr:DUF4175 domain-containing protein [Saprospiraceae bacterium]